MKKRLVVLCLGIGMSFLFCSNVYARSFTEERSTNYQFDIFIPSGNRHLIKQFTKITDEEGNPFYEVSPKSTYFNGRWDFEEIESTFDLATLEKFSKILYFGYGYQGKKEDSYYFATQYLLYQVFSDLEVNYKLDGIVKDDFKEEIAEIEKNIESVSFSLNDFTTAKRTYEIKDAYILDNFTVEGENVDAVYENGKIKLTFLNEKEEYHLIFHPKNLCENVRVWSSMNMLLMPKMEVCEKEYTITVNYQNPNQEPPKEESKDKEENQDTSIEDDKQNPSEIENPKEEQDKIDSNESKNQTPSDKKEENDSTTGDDSLSQVEDLIGNENQFLWDETLEASVPNTFKNDFPFLMVYFLLGAAYYVFKK